MNFDQVAFIIFINGFNMYIYIAQKYNNDSQFLCQ